MPLLVGFGWQNCPEKLLCLLCKWRHPGKTFFLDQARTMIDLFHFQCGYPLHENCQGGTNNPNDKKNPGLTGCIGTKLKHGQWFRDHGSWFMFMVHGSWFMVHGYGSWFRFNHEMLSGIRNWLFTLSEQGMKCHYDLYDYTCAWCTPSIIII